MSTSPIVALALSKADIDKAVRETIAPDRYCGEAVVRISYDLRVGAPSTQVVSAAVPWQRIACLALSKLNAACIDAVIREAAASTSASDVFEEIAERAKKVVADELAATERRVAGKVTGSVTTAVLMSVEEHDDGRLSFGNDDLREVL